MNKINIISSAKYCCNKMLLISLLVFSVVYVNAQSTKSKAPRQNYNIVITDQSGNPLPNVLVIVGEGEAHVETDKNGKVSFNAAISDYLQLSYDGFELKTLVAQQLKDATNIVMFKSRPFASAIDFIPLPYGGKYKRDVTNSTVVLDAKDLERYTGSDIRNAFTGLAAGLEVRELNGAPGLNVLERYDGNSTKVDVSLRGRSPIYIVDGIPTAMTEMPLDPSEIETVTIIKDIVAKAKYGPVAADGIIYIKTKRGAANERIIKVNAEKGISIVDRMPQWTRGVEYARLNNIARLNSDLPINTKFSDENIQKIAANDGYNMYFPNNDYVGMMFNNQMAYNRFNLSAAGGNEGIRYFSYLGLTNEGDLFKIGADADYNRIVSRSNLDIKVNEQLTVKLGVYGALGIRRSPLYSEGSEFLAFDNAIVGATRTSPLEFPVYANNSDQLEKPWFAVSSAVPNNPIGELTGKGFMSEQSRISSSNVTFDFDMSQVVKGLRSETYIGFNILNQVRKGKAENYTAYTVTPTTTSAGVDSIILTKVRDGVDQSGLSKLYDYYFQTFALAQTFSHTSKIGSISMLNSLTYNMSRAKRDGYTDDQRQHGLIWGTDLSFKDKYSLHAVLNYSGTYSFVKENRYAFFPTVGAAWNVTEEAFLKNNAAINYLKIRAEYGILGYDNFQAPFHYRDNYSTSNSGSFGPSTSSWLGSNTEANVPRTTLSRSGNPNLNWEKRREFNAGIDASFFKNKLYFEVTYFNQLRDGIISQVSNTIPSVLGLGGATARQNFEQIRYTGIELGLKYSDKIGDFEYSIGGNAMSFDGVYEKVDEPNFRNEYQSLKGKSIFSYSGLTYIGRYETDAETLEIPSLYDASLKAGDLKYKDMNGDMVIDDNDRSVIGRTAPRLVYSLNFGFKYKAFELNMIGTGRAFYDLPLTNSYFWNGWGEGNFSNFTRDNYNTDAYPRLTYNRVENNFRASNFWLTRGDFFKVQNVQLAYHLNEKWIQFAGLRSMKIFVNGTNLHTATKLKYVDPESINSGISTYPLFTNITAGVKLTF